MSVPSGGHYNKDFAWSLCWSTPIYGKCHLGYSSFLGVRVQG